MYLIPIYNIYFDVKLVIDFAKAFNKNIGYALGLIFVSELFIIMLGLGKSVFRDGEVANLSEDLVTRAIDACKKHEGAPVKDEKAVEKLEKLNDLKKASLMTEAEFEAKRKELIERI